WWVEVRRHNVFCADMVLRLFLFPTDDDWSYVAGFSRLPPAHVLAATAVGDFPSIALFSFVGQGLLENPAYRWWLAIGGGVVLAGALAYRWWFKRGAS